MVKRVHSMRAFGNGTGAGGEEKKASPKRVVINEAAAVRDIARMRGASSRRKHRRSSLPQRGSVSVVAGRARHGSQGGNGGRDLASSPPLTAGRTASPSTAGVRSSATSVTGERPAALWPLKGLHSYSSFRLARRHRGSSHAISYHFNAAHAAAEAFAASVLSAGTATIVNDTEQARLEQEAFQSKHRTGHSMAMKQLMANARRIRLRTKARLFLHREDCAIAACDRCL